jgi:arylsulfatase A-like enzyme
MLAATARAATNQPNIVFILADDIGYGDLGCYGATKIKTPNCDRLAREGLRFTDAHSSSAMCTPSRYSLMTGEYAFRRKGTDILAGGAALIIQPGRVTLPSLLKQAGYTCGVVGKWHLGFGGKGADYNAELKPGPLEIGFDYAWILPATGDRVPCVWVENRRVVNLDPADPIQLDLTVPRGDPRSYVNGIPRLGEQRGGRAALWKDDEIADTLAAKAVAFMEKNRAKPFFLYLATHDIHVPRVPNARFKGMSQAGLRGDTVHSFDWTVGQVLECLDRLKLGDSTMVIVSSDNGGSLDSNGPDKEHGGTVETNNGHPFNGSLRAGKASLYEGGTRVPFIVRWPGHVPVGVSDALLCQVDMLASVAALTGRQLAEGAGPDSENLLPVLLGAKVGRASLVEHAHGQLLAVREGTWKYIPAAGMGVKPAYGLMPEPQLYDLSQDIGETRNVAKEQPERVVRMQTLFERLTERRNP